MVTIYVLKQRDGCGDPECCGEYRWRNTGVTLDINEAKEYSKSVHNDYDSFEYKQGLVMH